MIIIGYQGVGKSSIAKVNPFTCIDLESSWTKIDGQRPDEWAKIYCQIAEGLSKAGYNVFVSSHREVQNALIDSDEHVLVIYPSLDIKEKWIERLKLRYETTGSQKNYIAWKDAEKNYDAEIQILAGSPYEKFEINDMNYRMEGIMSVIQNKPSELFI